MSDIKETKEIINALRAIAVRSIRSLKNDGKISLIEGISFIADYGTIKDAVVGSNKVLLELQDLDDNELVEIRTDIYNALKDIGVEQNHTVIVDAVLVWLKSTFDLIAIIKNPPVTALEVV